VQQLRKARFPDFAEMNKYPGKPRFTQKHALFCTLSPTCCTVERHAPRSGRAECASLEMRVAASAPDI